MRKSLVLAVVLPAALAAPASPASASSPSVTLMKAGTGVAVGAGYLVGQVCAVRADTEPPDVVPIATYVLCTINGFGLEAVEPGPVAAIAVPSAVGDTTRICISGYAVFDMGGSSIYTSPLKTECTDV